MSTPRAGSSTLASNPMLRRVLGCALRCAATAVLRTSRPAARCAAPAPRRLEGG
jgi:hypothetical protein